MFEGDNLDSHRLKQHSALITVILGGTYVVSAMLLLLLLRQEIELPIFLKILAPVILVIGIAVNLTLSRRFSLVLQKNITIENTLRILTMLLAISIGVALLAQFSLLRLILAFCTLFPCLVLSRTVHPHSWLLIFSILSAGLFLLPGQDSYLQAYDAPTHVFFASSYARDWWGEIEPRWSGGYSKFSYPPLLHQLIAIISFTGIDISIAYTIVLWLFMIFSPIAFYLFARNFTSTQGALFIAFLSILLPSTRMMIFSWGQAAGYTGLILTLFALGWLGRYICTGRWINLLLTIVATATAATTHHNTILFFWPTAFGIVLVAHSRSIHLRVFLRRTLSAIVLSILAIIVAIIPFWLWVSGFEIQTPIPHPSRENIFADIRISHLYFYEIYGFFLLYLPIIIFNVFKKLYITYLLLLCGLLFYLILGLGGTTTLPALIFGYNWNWLTFERFTIWSTVFLLVLSGITFYNSWSLTTRWVSSYIVTYIMIYTTIGGIANVEHYRMTPDALDLDPIVRWLNTEEDCRELYLGFGFNYQFPELSTYTNATTLDGYWYTARTDPLLRQSGVGALNDALYWTNGRSTLEAFLAREEPVPANCILLNDYAPYNADYRDILRSHNWVQVKRIASRVSVWQKATRSGFAYVEQVKPRHSISSFLWGFLPPTFALLTVLLTLRSILSHGNSSDNYLPT